MMIRIVAVIALGLTTVSLAFATALLINTRAKVDEPLDRINVRCITAAHDDGTRGWFCDGKFIVRESH